MKKFMSILLIFALIFPLSVSAEPTIVGEVGAVILMEKLTGEVLFEENSHEKLEPASVTKVMTLLLIMESLDSGQISLTDEVRVYANAAGMGGSQVFLKENEVMTVDEMLKAIAVASGNDASVAMAEYLCGSEEAFVVKMNEKASLLGMNDTKFCNCTGLPADGHLTSAYDIALMSRELILYHSDIANYTTIWMDTLRNGAFQLANTNKLIYYYEGATGLKTGSTDNAGYCLSATAMRDNMELIAVVLGGDTSSNRFETAKNVLTYGFSTYSLVDIQTQVVIPPISLELCELDTVLAIPADDCNLLIEKENQSEIRTAVTLPDTLEAPILAGEELGEIAIFIGEELVKTIPLVAPFDLERKSYLSILGGFMSVLLFSVDTL